MKKRILLTILTALIIVTVSVSLAHAEVIPPYGEGQIGLHAAILCGELSLREAPGASSKVVKTLKLRQFHYRNGAEVRMGALRLGGF